jgi:DNA-binding NarL/FixJ family response regulator
MTTILVVDDGATDRELVIMVLRYAGYDALEAATGAQGLELARTERPDLIIADILMPTMDGYELVRELRNEPETADTPVIFYTATYVVDEAQRLADACGISHVLVKPSAPDTIIDVVGAALAAGSGPAIPVPSEEFHREHLRVVNSKLLQKVEELRSAVLPRNAHRPPDPASNHGPGAEAHAPGAGIEELLSERELEVLGALAEGATNLEIGQRLVIAETTVQSHVSRILRKLGARNRTEAAVRYLRRP